MIPETDTHTITDINLGVSFEKLFLPQAIRGKILRTKAIKIPRGKVVST